jgi:tRNA-specific 2-thiouridylase
MTHQAIALLSGGLDSTLAVKMMVDQGIGVTAVHFTSVFCNCSSKKGGCKLQARKVAEEFNIPITVIHKGLDYIKMVEHPPHGHGTAMNPCIDCRIYMLRKVKEMMPQLQASFVITGEVLGQRPMSQQRHTITLIERESGLTGRILRPLSAQHFAPTIPENDGIVNRDQLLAVSGRSRKPQIELAYKLGVKDYPCPAGGCLLTDKVIAARLRDLFEYEKDYQQKGLLLLTLGRHFRLSPDLKIILGRTEEENDRLKQLATPEYIIFEPDNFRGPTVLAAGRIDEQQGEMIGEMIAAYSQDEESDYQIAKFSSVNEKAVYKISTKKKSRETWSQYNI